MARSPRQAVRAVGRSEGARSAPRTYSAATPAVGRPRGRSTALGRVLSASFSEFVSGAGGAGGCSPGLPDPGSTEPTPFPAPRRWRGRLSRRRCRRVAVAHDGTSRHGGRSHIRGTALPKVGEGSTPRWVSQGGSGFHPAMGNRDTDVGVAVVGEREDLVFVDPGDEAAERVDQGLSPTPQAGCHLERDMKPQVNEHGGFAKGEC